jgi:hypothetical protein
MTERISRAVLVTALRRGPGDHAARRTQFPKPRPAEEASR